MSIALDIGASRLRFLRRAGNELVGRSLPAAFALVADEPAARDLLSRAELTFAAGDGELALIGDAALQHAKAFGATPDRLLRDGQVPRDDPPARELLRTLIESLLPDPPRHGERCGLVISPGGMDDHETRSFLTRLAQARGYDPLVLSSSLALVLATFTCENFSGIGITFGAGGCSISLVHRGRELLHVSESRGTDWIDLELAARGDVHTYDAAGARYLDAETVRNRREEITAPLTQPQDDFAGEVQALYHEIFHAALTRFGEELIARRLGPYALEAPVICGGGGVRVSGFGKALREIIEYANLPVPLGPLRIAPPDDFLIPRGALIHAEIESTINIAA